MSDPSRVTSAPLSGDQSLGSLVNSAVADLRRLIQMEKELAVAEVAQTVKRLAPAIAGFAIAAVSGVLIVLMGSIALAFGVANLFDIGLGWGFLIVAGLWLLLAAVGGLVGLRAVKKIKPPERTIRTVKDTADWARHPTNTVAAALEVR
ncbi:MAG: hypothetical protein QOE24_47 [Frankiales bacterium]|jgi:hypothetical protein|nr:hypothetical protein [Frankiales bacterium]